MARGELLQWTGGMVLELGVAVGVIALLPGVDWSALRTQESSDPSASKPSLVEPLGDSAASAAGLVLEQPPLAPSYYAQAVPSASLRQAPPFSPHPPSAPPVAPPSPERPYEQLAFAARAPAGWVDRAPAQQPYPAYPQSGAGFVARGQSPDQVFSPSPPAAAAPAPNLEFPLTPGPESAPPPKERERGGFFGRSARFFSSEQRLPVAPPSWPAGSEPEASPRPQRHYRGDY